MKLSRSQTAVLGVRFNEAADQVSNEFKGLDLAQQYRNAFARLLKWDPLGRVAMLGTDQRDLFLPLLAEFLSSTVQENGYIFDFGGGDGQTFNLVSSYVARGTTISVEEPNAEYLEDYKRSIDLNPRLKSGIFLASGLEQMPEFAVENNIELPQNGTVSAALGIHMIYFLQDLPGAVTKMYGYLRNGGALFIVFADEEIAYTGHIARAYYSVKKQHDAREQLNTACKVRKQLFGEPGQNDGDIIAILEDAFPHHVPRVEVYEQPSRLFGHNLADIIAVSNITVLAEFDDPDKFAVARTILEENPEVVDLAVEEEGDRKGMLSVAQSQRVITLHKGAH